MNGHVNCLALCSDDSKIAAGTTKGSILVHSLKHNASGTLQSPFDGVRIDFEHFIAFDFCNAKSGLNH